MFDTVLVADRGLLARRVVRTCQRLGARAVTVHSAADAGAPHAADADESLLLGAPDPSTSYLDGRKVLEAAGQCAAQAVHPGGGGLATSAAFAASVRDAGLAWIGPPAEALEATGRLARSAPRGERRIAVQVLGVDSGRVVAVADFARRHGVVECPAADLPADVRAAAHAAAVAVGASVGLVGPATVDVAVGETSADVAALGLRPHLDADHPVVELVTGVDLVEQQLLLASGAASTYGAREPDGVALQVELRVRAAGVLHSWRPPRGDDVRVEAGSTEGEQTSSYDDLLATLAVWAPDRDAARNRLDLARAALVVDGVELR